MKALNTVPRSRIMLTYDTTQPDQPRQEKELPLRLLLVGDLTGRKWKPEPKPGERAAANDDFEERKIHDLNGRNLDAVMKKLNIAVHLKGIPNCVVQGGQPFDVTIPITSMKSFEPGEVVKHVPELERLLKIRRQLLDLQALVDNNKQFRGLVRRLTSAQKASLLEEVKAKFENRLSIAARQETNPNPLPPGPTPPPPGPTPPPPGPNPPKP